MKVAVERRGAPEKRLAQKLAWPLRLSGWEAWKLVLLSGWMTGCADLLTGSQVWFGPVYLIIIALAAWSLGWLQAVGVGLVSLGVTLAVNGYELYPYSGVAGAWNIGVRVVAVLVLIGLLHTVRQMYAREWRLSRTDLLTGALNRKAFFELTTPRKTSRGWSMLVYADLDGFKGLNDRLGHTAGDECLSVFSRAVAKAIRKEDVFARLGGDEFAIYLDLKDQAAAKAVAVRLHRSMNAAILAGRTSVGCSVGALILAPGSRSIDAEVRGADRLMYEAKGLGSSLVVGTANQLGGVVSIDRHLELTPDSPRRDDPAVDETGPRNASQKRMNQQSARLEKVA
jgi:diguanylate cyclase (GGDEF)-like protein